MGKIKSNNAITPQNYIEMITGKCYIFRGDNDRKEIHDILKSAGFENSKNKVKDYKLTDTARAITEKTPMVLVSCWKYPQIEQLIWFPAIVLPASV